jgi:short-subunit dehydrogenase
LPGDVKTGFTKARKVALKAQEPSSPYHGMTVRGIKHMEKDEQKEGMPPKVIADAVLRQLKKKRMKPEVTPSFLYSVLVWAIRRFPQSIVLKVIWKMYS